jgi:predicted helicase
MVYQWFNIYNAKEQNIVLAINNGSSVFIPLVSNVIVQQGTLLVSGGSTQCLPFYTYSNGNRQENITEWGLQQFRNHYQDAGISKEAIFAYVYAVLHYPAYRERYEQNLKRDFPRVPFYPDFNKWAVIGQRLIDLHIGYEQAAAYPLGRTDKQVNNAQAKLKVKLKANPLEGSIEIDEQTRIDGIPEAAWLYKLGNRSALEWVLDQYKEKTPADDTIREQFNTYRFADYKEDVIALLAKLCTVSVETMELYTLHRQVL